MKSTILASASLLALASAQSGIPTVTIRTVPCASAPDQSFQSFSLAVNAVGVTKIAAKSICGLSLTSSSTLPLSSISCQAFKDDAGLDPGSALFTAANPARISTNPVDIKAVWCRDPQYNGPGANGTTSASVSVSVSAGLKPTISLGKPIEASQTAEGLRPPVQTGDAGVTGGVGGNMTTFTGEGAGVRMGLGGLVVAIGAGVLVL